MDQYKKFLALVHFYEPLYLKCKSDGDRYSGLTEVQKTTSNVWSSFMKLLAFGHPHSDKLDKLSKQSSLAKKELLTLSAASGKSLKKEEAEVNELLLKYNCREKNEGSSFFNARFNEIVLDFYDLFKLLKSEKSFDTSQSSLCLDVSKHPFISDEICKLFLYLSMDDYKQDIIRFSYIYNFLIDSSIDKSLPESEYFKFIKREVYPELKTTRLNQHATNERRVKKLEESYRKYVKSKDV